MTKRQKEIDRLLRNPPLDRLDAFLASMVEKARAEEHAKMVEQQSLRECLPSYRRSHRSLVQV